MKKAFTYFAMIALMLSVSCSKDDDGGKAMISLSVYYHNTGGESKLDTDSYCWFGLFDCKQSDISSNTADVYNIADKKVVTLKDGTTIQPKYKVSTNIGTTHLEDIEYGKYTVVVCCHPGSRPMSSYYHYYGAKTVVIDNPAGNVVHFDFELGMDKCGKLINQ